MKRQPARLPSARQSSSSAEVWWISSTIRVSSPVIRSSCSHRRAMPVVTITTFHVGVSGVASRSRLTTPTRSGSPTISAAIGRIASVFPVPVPATIPKPRPDAARRRRSSPCSRSSTVSTPVSCTPISIVSQEARVGAITTIRPSAGRPG
jgi:hypothetical protein